MGNLFNTDNYPDIEPTILYIGDRWTWKRADLGVDYDTDDYSLTYSLRLAGTGSTEIEITAGESNGDYVVEESYSTTAAYTPGVYHWQAYITRTSDSERVVVDEGVVTIKANRDASTANPQSHAEITLDAIESAIQALNFGVSSYAIGGRSMTYRDLGELEAMRDKYLSEVDQEYREANDKGGNKIVYKL